MKSAGPLPRLALVIDPAEPDSYPAGDLLNRARDDGWMAEIIYDRPVRRSYAAVVLARGLRRRPADMLRAVRRRTPPGRRLRAAMVALAPQVLHLPSARISSGWLELAGRIGARVLVSVRSDEVSATAFELPGLYGNVWEAADGFQVESLALAEMLAEHGAPRHAVSVIPPVVDQHLLEPQSSFWNGGGPLRILSAGPLSWTHCYEHAIQAIKLLQDQGVRSEYRIVGRGAHLDAVVFAIHQLGLEDCVKVVEPTTPNDLRARLRWAQAFVQVAVVPAAPKTLIDAQAAGVPVISTEPPDELPESVLSVPALDPEALSDALARLVRDESLRAKLVSTGRERARCAPGSMAQTTSFRELHRRLAASV